MIEGLKPYGQYKELGLPWLQAIKHNESLDEDGQVDFKGKAKAFTRTYDFLASILPYTNPGW